MERPLCGEMTIPTAPLSHATSRVASTADA